LDDLRLVAKVQNASAPFAGAFLFESGWEFGYLWSAIAHYEACWDPHLEENDTTSATAAVLMEAGMDDHFGRGWASTFAKRWQHFSKASHLWKHCVWNSKETIGSLFSHFALFQSRRRHYVGERNRIHARLGHLERVVDHSCICKQSACKSSVFRGIFFQMCVLFFFTTFVQDAKNAVPPSKGYLCLSLICFFFFFLTTQIVL
jgi:hypothetical protein